MLNANVDLYIKHCIPIRRYSLGPGASVLSSYIVTQWLGPGGDCCITILLSFISNNNSVYLKNSIYLQSSLDS